MTNSFDRFIVYALPGIVGIGKRDEVVTKGKKEIYRAISCTGKVEPNLTRKVRFDLLIEEHPSFVLRLLPINFTRTVNGFSFRRNTL